jgi:hypothetical protein
MDRLGLIRAGVERLEEKKKRFWRMSPAALPTSDELPMADISDIERVQREMAAEEKSGQA